LKSLEAVFGPNSALVEELYKQYQDDPDSVPGHWKRYFDELDGIDVEEAPSKEENGAPVTKEKPKAKKEVKEPAEKKKAEPKIPEGAELEKIKGVASKIVDNMDESVYVPTATSLRVLPVKMMTESLFHTFNCMGCYTSLERVSKHQFILHRKRRRPLQGKTGTG